MSLSHAIADPKAVKDFALAGRAHLTLVSEKSGDRLTFRIKQRKPGEGPHFVGVLTGTDNTSSYSYLGTIYQDGGYKHGRKSKIGEDSISAKAFKWFHSTVLSRGVMPPQLTVMHEGKCGRCGRMLTVPESIERGIGPECAKHFRAEG